MPNEEEVNAASWSLFNCKMGMGSISDNKSCVILVYGLERARLTEHTTIYI